MDRAMEAYEQKLEKLHQLFNEWLDKQTELLEIGMKESLGNAYFAAYEQGLKDSVIWNDASTLVPIRAGYEHASISVLSNYGEIVYFDDILNKWFNEQSGYEVDVKAWCFIPEYKE